MRRVRYESKGASYLAEISMKVFAHLKYASYSMKSKTKKIYDPT